MRIYIDFDDVLCETARHLSELARDLYGRRVPYEAISVFDLREAFSLSAEEIDTLMARAHDADFLTELAPAPGGIEAVRALEADGHDLVIVTGRPATSHDGTSGWLRKHGLGHIEVVYFDKYGRAKEPPAADAPKTLTRDEFERLHFDVAIDDSPTALDLLAHRCDCTVFVFNRPWNQTYRMAPSMRRSSSWTEILSVIGSLGRQ